jgi:hypothetical protein
MKPKMTEDLKDRISKAGYRVTESRFAGVYDVCDHETRDTGRVFAGRPEEIERWLLVPMPAGGARRGVEDA